MKLKWPNSDIDFDVYPRFFLGCFDIYDREESLGEYLNQFNPNIEKDLLFLFSEKLFSGSSIDEYSIDHKYVILKMLAGALNDPEYDFEGIIFDEEDEYFCLPFEWDIEDPRFFFEVAYKAAFNHWGDELIKSNRKVLHPDVCTKN